MTALFARFVPPAARGGRLAVRVVERNALIARRTWLVIASGFAEPVFYLLAVDRGLGDLVGTVAGPDGSPVSYAMFAAPALLAAAAMNGAVYEATFAVFFRLRYQKVYEPMLATPVRPSDIAVGEIVWSQVRGLGYATAFLVIMAVLGLVGSPWALLAVPAAVLLGFAFGAIGVAAVTVMHTWVDLDMTNLALVPLFLFSATFYPLDVYPRALQLVTQLSPLYHGVALIRGLTLGVVGPGLLWHVVVLVSFTVLAGLVGVPRLHRQLRP